MNVRQLMALLSDEDPDAEVIVEPYTDRAGVRTGPIHPIARVTSGTFPREHHAINVSGSHPDSDRWVAIGTTDVWGHCPTSIPKFKTDAEWEVDLTARHVIYMAAGRAAGIGTAIDVIKDCTSRLFLAGHDVVAAAVRDLIKPLTVERLRAETDETAGRKKYGWPGGGS